MESEFKTWNTGDVVEYNDDIHLQGYRGRIVNENAGKSVIVIVEWDSPLSLRGIKGEQWIGNLRVVKRKD